MKTIEFKITRVRRKFYYKGIELRIVYREEPYMNATSPTIATRVLSVNGGTIPISINHKETLRSITAKTVEFLDNMEVLGYDIKQELTKELSN